MEAAGRKTGSGAVCRSFIAGAAGVALALSGAFAAYLACRKRGAGKAACAAESACVPAALLLLLQFVTNSSPPFNLSLLANVLCVICGALAGCLLTARHGARRRKRRRGPARKAA